MSQSTRQRLINDPTVVKLSGLGLPGLGGVAFDLEFAHQTRMETNQFLNSTNGL